MRAPFLVTVLSASCLFGCDNAPATKTTAAAAVAAPAPAANADPAVPADPTNIVNIAGHSKDHTTLVAALKAADYVDSVSNPGPLTVFAPTNAAFDKLPKGTLDELVKPEKKEDLRNILKYHVAVSTYQQKDFKDGQVLAMANGAKVTFHVKDGKVSINDANIVASIPASNGIVHVIDGVLLPPPPKP
jgi:uncharacterized surface protein with fasciclin (FAS1) repeats